MEIGTGNRVTSEVGAVIERTINWIERDMTRPPASPARQVAIKQQSPPYQQTMSTKQPLDNALAPGGARATVSEPGNPATTNGASYYDPGIATPATSYPALNYGDQTAGAVSLGQNGTGVVDSTDGAQYLYAAASAATAATAANTTAAAMEQAAAAQNPLIAFASQATQHVSGQAENGWNPQPTLLAHSGASANTWQDWTNAIQDTQDRYSANALLTLNSGRPGDVSAASGVVNPHAPGPGDALSGAHTGQWPLLLFHDGSGNVSGP